MRMAWEPPELNLALAWVWIVCGFVSGAALGLGFHREGWLGGYGSFQRRLYRLAHISFFGLAILNLLFFFTARQLPASPLVWWAGIGFAAGAVAMPVCCVLMAHHARCHLLFGIPVGSLLAAGLLTCWEVMHL